MSLFEQVSIDISNSFLPLSQITDHTGNTHARSSISSLDSNNLGSPRFTSSPHYKRAVGRSQPARNFKVLVANLQSAEAKKETFWELLGSSNPDIIIASETWLTPAIQNSKVIPENYQVYRTDRADGYGGVLIGIKDDIIADKLEIDHQNELVAVKITTVRKNPLIIISAYRPTNKDEVYISSLCDTISDITHSNPTATIWCAGDFNVPDIDWKTDSATSVRYPLAISERVLNLVHECNFEQMVDFPTREDNTLDLFMTNRPSLINRCEPIPGVSDHEIVYVDSEVLAKRQKPIRRKIYLWSKADFDKVRADINEFSRDFTTKYDEDTPVETLWSTIKMKLENTLSSNIPSKLTSTRFSQPWINQQVKTLKRRKQRCYNQLRKKKTPQLRTRYKELKKEMQQTCRRAYEEYMHNIICGDYESGNKKRFYSYVKSLRTDNSGVAPLKCDGITHTDSISKAEILNQQFSSVFTREQTDDIPDKGISPHHTIPELIINSTGVAKLLKNLNPHKATGPDQVPARLLKEIADQIASVFQTLFTASLKQGTIPEDWRKAMVSPIFKKGERYKPANYRPVSLTSIVCKIMEHIVHHHLISHLEKNGILTDYQHGFRKRRSCESQLIQTINDLAKNLNEGGQIDAVLLDFSKAFDKVPHHRLLHKLEYYGIRGPSLNWISAFLHNRTQNVVCEGNTSSPAEVISGVPQGTVLGPLLFLAYINDLPECVSSTVRLFADDCLLYREIKSEDDSKKLQEDLAQLEQWEKNWLMSFNPDKCEVLRVTLKRKPLSHDYNLHGHTLNTVPAAKYLGITIDSKLTFNKHINTVYKKANSTNAFIARTTKRCPPKVRADAYTTYVRPNLEYAASVWAPHTKTNINKLESVQRRAARHVTKDYRRTSNVTNMLKKLQWETLQERRAKSRTVVFYKIVHGLIDITMPSYITTPTGTTRGHNMKYRVPAVRINAFKYSFFPQAVNLWNSLPTDTVNAGSLDYFKARLSASTLIP